jgi:hypothetical protein
MEKLKPNRVEDLRWFMVQSESLTKEKFMKFQKVVKLLPELFELAKKKS